MEIYIPGDKSISHGNCDIQFNVIKKNSIRNFLQEKIVTLQLIMRQLGVDIIVENDKNNNPVIVVNGVV